MATLQTHLSLNEFIKLPQTKPALEYIDGSINPQSIPKGKHSIIQSLLVAAIMLLLNYAAPLQDVL